MNKFKITIDGNDFDVTVDVTDHKKANVEVNGISYEVTYESKNTTVAPVARKNAVSTTPAAQQVHVSAPVSNSGASSKAPLPGTISSINVKWAMFSNACCSLRIILPCYR